MFETTTAALWAEEVAQDHGIPVDVVPAPADAKAKCDLALLTLATHEHRLTEALTEQGVTWRRWPPAPSDPATGDRHRRS